MKYYLNKVKINKRYKKMVVMHLPDNKIGLNFTDDYGVDVCVLILYELEKFEIIEKKNSVRIKYKGRVRRLPKERENALRGFDILLHDKDYIIL